MERIINCERCNKEIVAKRITKKLCADCIKENNQKLCREGQVRRNKENPEHQREIRKRSYDNHREERVRRSVEYGKAHPEWRYESHKKWLAEHPGYSKQSDAKYYQNNKVKRQSRAKAWQEANPERFRQTRQARLVRYRARLANATGEWTVEQFNWLCEMLEHRCYYCGQHCEKLTVDHMTPLSREGSNDISNIIPSCGPCNYSKRNKTAEEFIAWRKGRSA